MLCAGTSENRTRSSRLSSDELAGQKSEKYRAAIQACHDAELGEKPAMAARRAFMTASREVDILGWGLAG
ncbi:DUF982 domain-containing protein [Mesorhizobium liriopis]|uniref:DUF982 domain-containing protein n=1 Tax=Mesorhizobium liriopis TaxID=2953882 RepID=UPI00338E0702